MSLPLLLPGHHPPGPRAGAITPSGARASGHAAAETQGPGTAAGSSSAPPSWGSAAAGPAVPTATRAAATAGPGTAAAGPGRARIPSSRSRSAARGARLRYRGQMDPTGLPVPPGGMRPGHLGVIATGQVILVDIAATAADLSLRGLLRIDGTTAEAGGWTLTPAEPPQDAADPLEYEQLLLEWLARPGYGSTSLTSLATSLPAGLAEVREGLVHDAVQRGWLRRLHHGERTKAGEELASQLPAFHEGLSQARAERGPEALDGQLLPYALHFDLARPEHPLTQFSHAWVSTFADLPEWRAPARWRTDSGYDAGIRPAARKRTLDGDIMSHDVAAMQWLIGQ